VISLFSLWGSPYAKGQRSGDTVVHSHWTKLLSQRASFLRDYITCVERCLALDEHEQALMLRDRVMAYTLWDYEHFSFIKLNIAILHLDSKMTLEYEEQLVFVFVAVPSERTLDLGNLDV